MPNPGDDFRVADATTLDSSGSGQVDLSPPAGVTWEVSSVSCVTSTRVKEPVFKLYLDAVSDTAFLEGSFSGSQDTTGTPRTVRDRTLIGVWTGGDAGARATMIVAGTVGARR